MAILRVKEWDEWFENSKSRTFKSKSQCAMPNKHGLGYRRLINLPNGAALFGAWCAMVQVLSRQRHRDGYLTLDGKRAGKPLDVGAIAELTLMPVEICREMLAACGSEAVEWLVFVKEPEETGTPQGYNGDTTGIQQGQFEDTTGSCRAVECIGLDCIGLEGVPRAKAGELGITNCELRGKEGSAFAGVPASARLAAEDGGSATAGLGAAEVVGKCRVAWERLQECGPDWKRLSLEMLVEMVRQHPRANLAKVVDRVRSDWMGQAIPAIKTPPMIVRQCLQYDVADRTAGSSLRGGAAGKKTVEELRMERVGGGRREA